MAFGRKPQPELTERHLAAAAADRRAAELARDPSDIPGMTQAELNNLIDIGTIPTALLREIL